MEGLQICMCLNVLVNMMENNKYVTKLSPLQTYASFLIMC